MDEDKKNKLFGQLAVKLGYVTVADVKTALIKQETDEITGQRKHLGTYFFTDGLLTKEQISQVIQLQKKYIEKLEEQQTAESAICHVQEAVSPKPETTDLSNSKANVHEAPLAENKQNNDSGIQESLPKAEAKNEPVWKTLLKLFKSSEKKAVFEYSGIKFTETKIILIFIPLALCLIILVIFLGGEMRCSSPPARDLPKEGAQAVEALETQAWSGSVSAQYNLGLMYKAGGAVTGVSKDYKKAFDWFEKAAKQGHHDALKQVGLMYFHGEGVAKDLAKAYAYLDVAVSYRVTRAEEFRGAVQSEMSAEQTEKAKEIRQRLEETIRSNR